MANSEWRVANGEWRMVSSEWRTVFLEGRVPALPRNFRHLVTSDAVVANRQSLFSALRVHCHFDGFMVTGVDGCLDCLLPLGKREFVGDEAFEQRRVLFQQTQS